MPAIKNPKYFQIKFRLISNFHLDSLCAPRDYARCVCRAMRDNILIMRAGCGKI